MSGEPRVYLAHTDRYGVLNVERFSSEDWTALANIGETANDYPDVIYFYVDPPRNHVSFYASQDVSEGGGEPLSTWSVYREEYRPSDLDPIDGLTVVVATVRDEVTAHRLADHLFALQVNDR